MQLTKRLIEDGVEVIEDVKEVVSHGKEIIEDRKELIEDLFEKAEEYVKTNIEIAKLKATDKVAEIVSSLIAQIAIVVLSFFFLLMLNIGIAFWLGTVTGVTHYGFMIVAGFYALLVGILFVFRKEIIKTPINNSIINQILNIKP